jgi:type I restriction enzyme, S subunit
MSAGWSKVSLGEVLHLSDTSVPCSELGEVSLAGVYSFGRGLFARGPMLPSNTSYRSYNRLVVDDFVISQPKAWEGALARVTHDFDGWYLSPVFSTFRADSSRLEPAFLDWFCKRKAVWTELQRNSRGIGARRETVSPETFLTLQIPLPPPAEQRRIVARIEDLAAEIEKAKALRKQATGEAEALYSKLLDASFSSCGSQMTDIGEAFRVTTGGTPSRSNPAYWGGDVNWVSSGEVAFCRIRDTREKITRKGVEGSNAKIYPPSTVLLAMIGQGKTRGQCAILDCKAATNQNVAAIHVYETEHLPEYVYWWLLSSYQRSRATETGTAQPALSGERVKRMPIPLPPPAEQRRILAELDALQAEVDALKRLQAETAAELDALLPSILDKAFKGEL